MAKVYTTAEEMIPDVRLATPVISTPISPGRTDIVLGGVRRHFTTAELATQMDYRDLPIDFDLVTDFDNNFETLKQAFTKTTHQGRFR